MQGFEERPFIPRYNDTARSHREQSGAVVGSQGILENAIARAAACAPQFIRDMPQNSCGAPGVDGNCGPYRISRQSQNTTANSAVIALSYTFNRPFKLAKLTIPSGVASTATLTSIKVAGEELLRDGSVNGGPFSDANEESGGEMEGPWLEAGLALTITGTFSAAPATAQAITVAGVVRTT